MFGSPGDYSNSSCFLFFPEPLVDPKLSLPSCPLISCPCSAQFQALSEAVFSIWDRSKLRLVLEVLVRALDVCLLQSVVLNSSISIPDQLCRLEDLQEHRPPTPSLKWSRSWEVVRGLAPHGVLFPSVVIPLFSVAACCCSSIKFAALMPKSI